MNKHATALAGLITAASIATGTAVSAQAHTSHLQMHMSSHHTSRVATARLQAMLQHPSHDAAGRAIRPNDGGALNH